MYSDFVEIIKRLKYIWHTLRISLTTENEEIVCRLKKTIYGMNQVVEKVVQKVFSTLAKFV